MPDTNYLPHHPHQLEAIPWATLDPAEVEHLIVAIATPGRRQQRVERPARLL